MAPTVKLWHNGKINGRTPSPEDLERFRRQNSSTERMDNTNKEECITSDGPVPRSESKTPQKNKPKGEKSPGGRKNVKPQGISKNPQKKNKENTNANGTASSATCIQKHVPPEVLAFLNEKEQAAAIMGSLKYGYGPWCLPADFDQRRLDRYQDYIDGEETEDEGPAKQKQRWREVVGISNS